MAETDVFPDIGWDYPLDVPSLDGVLRQRAHDGTPFSRIVRPDLRVFELVRRAATTDQREQLEAFYRQHQAGFFRFDHKVWVNDGGTLRPRSFPVVFDGPPEIGLARNESWPISVRLVEAAGKPIATALFANTGFDKWTAGVLDNWTNPGSPDGDGGSQAPLDVVSGLAYQINGDGVSLTRGLRTQDASGLEAGVPYTAIVSALRSSGWAAGDLVIDLLGTGVNTTGLVKGPGSLTTSYQLFQFDPTDGGLASIPSDLKLRVLATNTPTNGEFVRVDSLWLVKGSSRFDDLWPDPDKGHPSIFLEESAGTILSGTWNLETGSTSHGNTHRANAGIVTTAAFQWLYAGYGFRLWSLKTSNLGIVKVYLDETLLGEVNLYAASTVASAPVFEKLDVSLGLHRVKLEATNTKHASSSDFRVLADALEALL